MCLEYQISILEWFLKDHVTLKTWVIMLKIQICHHWNNYILNILLFSIVITFIHIFRIRISFIRQVCADIQGRLLKCSWYIHAYILYIPFEHKRLLSKTFFLAIYTIVTKCNPVVLIIIHDHIVHLNMNDSILKNLKHTYVYEIISSSLFAIFPK